MDYIGKRLGGRYQLNKLIGSGGMANVFEATDLLEDKQVAIKLLKEEYLTNDEFVRRFRNESKVIAVLDHKNIVKVFDVNFAGAEQYIVMEYIDGITMAQYIRHQGSIRWKDVVYFAKQILAALEHAHGHGVIHRDIKAQNIMLLRDGTIKVMDFGIARFAREDIRSMADQAIGSVHYISPEQACGQDSDEKSDIYSIGVLLYEMLTGHVPFDGETPEEIAVKHMQSYAKPIQEQNPDIPTGLCEIVEKAMMKDKALRYRSAREMLEAIEEFKKNPSIVFEYKYIEQETPAEVFDQSVRRIQHAEGDSDIEEEVIIKRSPTVMILTGIAFACCVTALCVLLGFFYWGRDEKVPEVKMPNLVGMDYKTVRKMEEYRKFNFVIEERELTDDYAEGQIYDQNIQPGILVKIDRTVRIKVSEGLNVLQVPDVIGKDVHDVEDLLVKQGLDYTVRTQVVEGIDADEVINVDPPVGTQVEKHSLVVLYVSRGSTEAAAKVPKVVGRDVEEAITMLEAVGLVVETREVKSDEEPGTVIEQSIVAHEYVIEGETITLSVSNGAGYLDKEYVQVDFPMDAATRFYQMAVLIDGEERSSSEVNPVDTPTVYVEVNGRGIQRMTVTLNGMIYAEYSINFKDDTVSQIGEYNFSALTALDPEHGDSWWNGLWGGIGGELFN